MIKNLFEVDGIFFVLAIDKEQLYSVVEHTFGVKKTEERDNRAVYLQKFVNMDYELCKPEMYEYVSACLQDISLRYDSHDKVFDIDYNSPLSAFESDFYFLYEDNGINSIREFEKVYERFYMVVNSYQLSSIEALIIWKTLLDKKPIVNLFKWNNFIYDTTYYDKRFNFIDSFILNLSLWHSRNECIIDEEKLADDAMICRLLLSRYILNISHKYQYERIDIYCKSFIDEQKNKFREIITLFNSISITH